MNARRYGLGALLAAALAVLAVGLAAAQQGGDAGGDVLRVRRDGARAVYVQDAEGEFATYVIGAPDFVNATFARRWFPLARLIATGTGTDVVSAELADGVHFCRVLLAPSERQRQQRLAAARARGETGEPVRASVTAFGRYRGQETLLSRYGDFPSTRIVVGDGLYDFEGAIDFVVEAPGPERYENQTIPAVRWFIYCDPEDRGVLRVRLHGARAVYVQDAEGEFATYVIGAPEFVNAAFAARWIAPDPPPAPTPAPTPTPEPIWTATGTGTGTNVADIRTAELADGVHFCRVQVSFGERREGGWASVVASSQPSPGWRRPGEHAASLTLLDVIKESVPYYDITKRLVVRADRQSDSDFEGAIDFAVKASGPQPYGNRTIPAAIWRIDCEHQP